MCNVFITNSYKYRKREGIEAIDICCRSERGHFFSPFKYENVSAPLWSLRIAVCLFRKGVFPLPLSYIYAWKIALMSSLMLMLMSH